MKDQHAQLYCDYLQSACYEAAKDAGWWTDAETGEDLRSWPSTPSAQTTNRKHARPLAASCTDPHLFDHHHQRKIMSVIQIRKAQREGARLVIGLAGVSGSGKTYTALQLAYGLTNGRADKIGFCDTENRRGSLYSDTLGEPFLIGDLTAPFSPQRYIDAIKAFSDAGVEVLVIDSITHAWEGLGGCQDIANQTRFPDWKNAKKEWKRMMDAILQSPCHVILCVRARDKMDFKDPKNPIPLGLQPIIEGNAMFEMTASAMMHDMGRMSWSRSMGCPAQKYCTSGHVRVSLRMV